MHYKDLLLCVVLILLERIVPISTATPSIDNLDASANVPESTSTELLLLTLIITDADSTSFTCSIGTGSNPANSNSFFRVRQDTGSTDWSVYTLAGVTFDNVVTPTYMLDIECSDGTNVGEGILTATVVNNEPPTFTNLPGSVSVSTNATIGDHVFTASTNDSENDQVYFTMTCTPTGCPFIIYESGGIYVNADLSGSTVVAYDVSVTVTDDKNPTTTPSTLSVTISDINAPPSFTNLNVVMTLPENTAASTLLVTASCSDTNAGDQLIYTMLCSPNTGLTYVTINSTSGQILTSAITSPNYEALLATGTASWDCLVTCSDGQVSDSATLNFTVTDVNEAPSFTQNAFSISADENVGGTVLQSTGYTILDQDASDTTTFSLDCGTNIAYFSFDSSTGALNFSSDYDVDTGTRPTNVTCSINVTDSGGLTDTASIVITINNVNDNTPQFALSFYPFFTSFGSPVSTLVGSVTATDGDIGEFGQLTYSLNQSSLSGEYFGIDQSGDIYIHQNVTPLGEGSLVAFSAIATDSGGLATNVSISVLLVGTTTTTTTTTTDRYRTFFEDNRSVTWFTLCCLCLLGIAVTSAYLLCRNAAYTKLIPKWCTRDWCRMDLMRPRYDSRLPVTPPSPRHERHRPSTPPSQVKEERPPARLFDFWSAYN